MFLIPVGVIMFSLIWISISVNKIRENITFPAPKHDSYTYRCGLMESVIFPQEKNVLKLNWISMKPSPFFFDFD